MLVTLTTDYGLRDGYAAAVKGTMLTLAPSVQIVDVTHAVPPQDVMEAAFVLGEALPFFPDGTVHLATVEAATRSPRTPIAARFVVDDREYTFVGPDNGMLALLTPWESVVEAVRLDRAEWWRVPQPSRAFDGLDRLGPVAAHLAAGVALDRVGSPTDDFVSMHWPMPKADDQGIDGWVAHIDRYGNCVTNITRDHVEQHAGSRALKCFVGSTVIREIHDAIADVASGEAASAFDSSGRLTIGINGGNAAEMLSVHRGASVNVVFEAAPSGDGDLRPARTPAAQV